MNTPLKANLCVLSAPKYVFLENNNLHEGEHLF
jgi:hypothetical protein